MRFQFINVLIMLIIKLHVDSGEMAGVKRKHVVLSIEEKLEVVQMLKTSSQKVIAEKFGVRKNTVAAIRRMKQNS